MTKIIKNKTFFTLIFILVFFAHASIVHAAVPEYTDAFYVNDFARVLSDETTRRILEMSENLCDLTGAEFVVVTVDFSGGQVMEDYAISIFNDWKLGDAQKNNGLLLLLSIGDDDYYALQGKGLETKLSAGTLGDLLYTYLEPDFADGKYDAGVRKVYDAILGELEKIYAVNVNAVPDRAADVPPANQTAAQNNNSSNNSNTNRNGGSGMEMITLLIVFFIMLFFISLFSGRMGRRYYGRPRGWFIAPFFRPRTWRGGYWRHHHHHAPPPRPPMGGNRPTGGNKPMGGFGGSSGGVSRGGGAGRSTGFGGGGRPSGGGGISRGGGFSGGGRSGGGGMSRGGGAGRR